MFGTQEQTQNGPWLVKSGDRVLGPFTTDEVSRLLRAKEIVVIDEVISPEARWTYVRDVPAFHPVVEEIRRGLLQAREDTEIQGYTDTVSNQPQATHVTSATQAAASAPDVTAGTATNLNNMSDYTLTNAEGTKPTIPNIPLNQPPSKPAATSVPKAPSPLSNSSPAQPLAPSKEKRPELQPLMPSAPVETTYTMKPARRRPPGLVVGIIVLVVATVFMIYTVSKKQSASGPLLPASTENLETQASVSWKRGEFERALDLYRAIDRQKPKQPAVVARVALLMMQLEGQTVEAKRKLQEVSDVAASPEAQSQIQIALGMAALHNEDTAEAVVRFSQAGDSWIANYDRGVAAYATKDWAGAIRGFEAAGDQAIGVLMLARSYLGQAEASGKANFRKQAEDAVVKGTAKFADYKQELLVVGTYGDLLSGNKKRAESRLAQAIEIDPDQTSDHFHDPALSRAFVSWSNFIPLCREIHTALDSNHSAALLSLCLSKANQIEDAGKTLETRISQNPSNAELHAVNAYVHMTADRDDAARASLTLAQKAGGTRLSQILSARLCSRDRQDACAEEGWSKLASEKNPPLASYTGLAQIKFQKGDTPTANALLVNAERVSPTYLPLLRLREDASR